MVNDPSIELLTKWIGRTSESWRAVIPVVWPQALVDLVHDAVGEEYGDDD